MTTVSGVSTPGMYGYAAAAANSGAPNAQKPSQLPTQAALAALENTLTSLGNSSSAPLTYNAAGLFGSARQGVPTGAGATMSSAQKAQNAVVAAENVVTDTLASLSSGGTASDSSNTSSSDIASLFALPGTSNAADPFGLPQAPSAASSAGGGTPAQTAQDAMLAAENVITRTLASLASTSSASGK